MRATKSQRLQLRAKRQRRKRKHVEEHAPHRAVMASTLGVSASAILAITGRLNEEEVATRRRPIRSIHIHTHEIQLSTIILDDSYGKNWKKQQHRCSKNSKATAANPSKNYHSPLYSSKHTLLWDAFGTYLRGMFRIGLSWISSNYLYALHQHENHRWYRQGWKQLQANACCKQAEM